MLLMKEIELKQFDFKNEKELQTYFENNLNTILNYKFIATEFVVGNFRIDTLAFDEETNSFKIIEYKNIKNNSLVDQGYTYLKLLLERKADFVLQYCLKTGKHLNISDIDWSQSRIVFVSPKFTPYQLNATDFKNIPVDLIKITRYEYDIVAFDFIKKTSNVKVEELNFDSKEVANEIKVYTEEDHLRKVTDKVRQTYETLKNRIFELDDIDMDVKKVYIAFKGKTNIADIEFTQNRIRININMKKGTLNDPLNITQDISDVGHWGNGDYRVDIYDAEEVDNVMPLIRQSLNINKK